MRIKEYMALLSKYRAPIMGACIINVLFGHSGMVFRGPANYLFSLYWTIDIFFFFSGMGAFHSLSRNSNTLEFYRRRFIRIYVPYLPIILVYLIITIGKPEYGCSVFETIRQILGNLLLVGWIAGVDNQLNWFPQTMLIVYLLTPIFFAFVKSFGGNIKKLSVFFGIFVLIQFCFMGSTYLVAVCRLLSFLLGLIAADLASRDSDIKLNIPIMLIVALIGIVIAYLSLRCDIELVWQYGVSWYPALLIIPGLMPVLAWIFKAIESKKIFRPLNWLCNISGRYSFEIFLVHLVFFELTARIRIPRSNLICALFAVIALALSLIYGKLTDKIGTGLKKA